MCIRDSNYIDPETSERLGVKRGLRNPDGTGVLAGLTNVCDVVGYKKDQEGQDVYKRQDIDSLVSMNMWALTPEFVDLLESGFVEFFEKAAPANPLKACLLYTSRCV